MHELLVIGAGLSGLMTANVVANNGRTVKLITKGLGGALHWSAGTIDLLGYLPAKPAQTVLHPQQAMIHLPENHPYRLMKPDMVLAAIDTFASLSREIGLPYDGASTPQENLLLPSPVGAVRPTYLAPTGQIAGDLRRQEPMLIIGFSGLRDFYPELIAENLTKQGFMARAVILPIQRITSRTDSNLVNLAQGLENPEQCQQLAQAVKPLVHPGERVGFPAILGMLGHTAVFNSLEKQIGAPIFEIPTLPPSIPGIRLYTAMRQKLLSIGVRIEAGMEVIAAQNKNKAVRWVESETSARPLKHRANQFVLATGGILGGGFDTNIEGAVRETVFNLPLSTPQQRSNWFRSSFLNPAGHPIFNGGVVVNNTFQPVDSTGQLLFNNVWAVGNSLAGCDPIQERSLEGVAIASGIIAGQAINLQS